MRFSALRFRFLALTVVFAFIIVGVFSLISYVVVTDAMTNVAESTMVNIASLANQQLREYVIDAESQAASKGLTGSALEADVFEQVREALPEILRAGSLRDSEFALYGADLRSIWSSSDAALNDHSEHRAEAIEHERQIDSGRVPVRYLSGLLTPADMGEYIAHVPVDLPMEGRGILDVTYLPIREEATIDRIRPWMLLLSITATLLAVVLMQGSTGWVLGLVGNLRSTADSVDTDRLDVMLPAQGRNEIADLARSINSLIERLRLRAEAQTRFVADASHELATPVAGIRGYVNILREWGGEDEALREEAVDAIDRESARMARLCGDLLSLIRRERFADMLVRRVDVNVLVREILASAATRYFDKGIEFVGPEEGQLTLYGDADRLSQVIGILVDNAAKYTSSAGGVTVSTRRRLEEITIEVADTGVGIPAKDLPHVFERFYRSDESRSTETGGCGIGLSIAKRLVELMGGKIDVDSTETVGTTFTIRLPRRSPHREEQ